MRLRLDIILQASVFFPVACFADVSVRNLRSDWGRLGHGFVWVRPRTGRSLGTGVEFEQRAGTLISTALWMHRVREGRFWNERYRSSFCCLDMRVGLCCGVFSGAIVCSGPALRCCRENGNPGAGEPASSQALRRLLRARRKALSARGRKLGSGEGGDGMALSMGSRID